jgi:hypothetical protein
VVEAEIRKLFLEETTFFLVVLSSKKNEVASNIHAHSLPFSHSPSGNKAR